MSKQKQQPLFWIRLSRGQNRRILNAFKKFKAGQSGTCSILAQPCVAMIGEEAKRNGWMKVRFFVPQDTERLGKVFLSMLQK